MAFATLPQEIRDAIQDGDPTVPPHLAAEQFTEKFGRHVSETSVKKYRARAKQQREEATQEIRAAHAQEHTAGALADLTELRTAARKEYLRYKNPKAGTLWLQCVKTELAVVGVDKKAGEFDALTDEQLEALANGDDPGAPTAEPCGPDKAREGPQGAEPPQA